MTEEQMAWAILMLIMTLALVGAVGMSFILWGEINSKRIKTIILGTLFGACFGAAIGLFAYAVAEGMKRTGDNFIKHARAFDEAAARAKQ